MADFSNKKNIIISPLAIKLTISLIIFLLATVAMTIIHFKNTSSYTGTGNSILSNADTIQNKDPIDNPHGINDNQPENKFTTATVSQHNTASNCWLIINNKVYDVTQYITFHPGGQQRIINYCGKEATQAFNTQAGEGSHSANANNLLANYYIGDLGQIMSPQKIAKQPKNIEQPVKSPASKEPVNKQTTTPPPPNEQTVEQPNQPTTDNQLSQNIVAQHNTASNCWLIINNKVYDVTQYIPFHPGGQQRIINYCGKEATQAFNTQAGEGSHSANANNLLANYYIGDLGGTSNSNRDTGGNNTPIPINSQPLGNPQKIILEQYPGATIIEVNNEDDGRSEIKFNWSDQKYEAKFDSTGNLIKVDD